VPGRPFCRNNLRPTRLVRHDGPSNPRRVQAIASATSLMSPRQPARVLKFTRLTDPPQQKSSDDIEEGAAELKRYLAYADLALSTDDEASVPGENEDSRRTMARKAG
jgi:hypothetical protein